MQLFYWQPYVPCVLHTPHSYQSHSVTLYRCTKTIIIMVFNVQCSMSSCCVRVHQLIRMHEPILWFYFISNPLKFKSKWLVKGTQTTDNNVELLLRAFNSLYWHELIACKAMSSISLFSHTETYLLCENRKHFGNGVSVNTSGEMINTFRLTIVKHLHN